MRLEHHLVGGYVRYISPHIILLLSQVTSHCVTSQVKLYKSSLCQVKSSHKSFLCKSSNNKILSVTVLNQQGKYVTMCQCCFNIAHSNSLSYC